MTVLAADQPRFDIGRVMNRTLGAIGRNFWTFLALSVVFSAIPQGFMQYAQYQLTKAQAGGGIQSSIWMVWIAAIIVAVLSAYVLQAALVHGTVSDLNERPASFSDCLATGLRFFLPLILMAIVMGFALFFAALLLIFPAFILAMVWLVAVPTEVVERRGVFASMSRSGELTRNHRWALFGLCIVWFVIVGVISMVVGGIAGAIALAVHVDLTLATAVATVPINVIQVMIGGAGIAAIYYELRSIKEGIGPEALAAVFD